MMGWLEIYFIILYIILLLYIWAKIFYFFLILAINPYNTIISRALLVCDLPFFFVNKEQTKRGIERGIVKNAQWIFNIWTMVLILDGNLEIGAHVRSSLTYLICFWHLLRSRSVTKRIFAPKRHIVLYARAT